MWLRPYCNKYDVTSHVFPYLEIEIVCKINGGKTSVFSKNINWLFLNLLNDLEQKDKQGYAENLFIWFQLVSLNELNSKCTQMLYILFIKWRLYVYAVYFKSHSGVKNSIGPISPKANNTRHCCIDAIT